MPILNPSQIHEVLRTSGIMPEKSDKMDLKNLLEKNNLSPADLLDHLSSIARCGETEASRLKAVEMGLKLNGMLQANEAMPPNVTIVINDPEYCLTNPILIPRS
jgi:hypothetical protein